MIDCCVSRLDLYDIEFRLL